MLKNESLLIPLTILIILSFAYGMTLAPGLSWANDGADGGDLITAAATGGVPHPSGYPLFLLLAAPFQKLPLGKLAFRTNLLSALSAMLASLTVYFLTYKLIQASDHRRVIAGLTSLIFGLSPLVWSQAVITEVHALQAFLVALALLQAFSSCNRRAFNFIRGLILGLALGNHLSSLFLLTILLWEGDTLRLRPISKIFFRFCGVGAGILIYVILPLRAMHQPPVNWENPVTISSFIDLVSGKLYQPYITSEFALQRMRGWAGLLIAQFTLLGVGIGVYALLSRDLILRTLPLVWLFLVHTLLSIFYYPQDSYLYLIEAVLIFSIWIGLGLAGLITVFHSLNSRVHSSVFGLLFLLLLIHARGVSHLVDASQDTRAEEFGRSVLIGAPHNAVVFSSDDRTSFALWYFHFALSQRPDIAVVVDRLLAFGWYRQNLRFTYPALKVPELSPYNRRSLISANPDLPVCLADYREEATMNCSP